MLEVSVHSVERYAYVDKFTCLVEILYKPVQDISCQMTIIQLL